MNLDAIILAVGIVMFILGFIAASIVHRQRTTKLKEHFAIEVARTQHKWYYDGWNDGADDVLQMVNNVVDKNRFAFVTWKTPSQ